MHPALEKLHDIEGLDTISRWPFSFQMWIALCLLFVCTLLLAFFIYRRIKFNRSWKKDTLDKLCLLEKSLSESTARENALLLSEYVKRIALRMHGRKECASLVGMAWLKWLKAHDPKDFDWEAKGGCLIEVPYAPLHYTFPIDQIQDLIQASKNWVR